MKKISAHCLVAPRLVALGLVLLSAPTLFVGALHAATIQVADGAVDVAADGVCSLREALHNALADAQVDNTDCVAGAPGRDTLALGHGALYELGDADAANPDNGLPEITGAVRIEGNQSVLRRDPTLPCVLDRSKTADEFRIFELTGEGAELEIFDLTLAHGCADGSGPANDGGAIRLNGGELSLARVVVEDNSAYDKSGGIDMDSAGSAPSVSITESTFRRNHGGGGAGAVGNGAGTLTVERSTFSNNTSGGDGGGALGMFAGSTTTLRNTTISGNASTGLGGGGIGNQAGFVTIDASTITDNSVTGTLGGGGIGNAGGMVIKNSIVAGNGVGGDCVDVGSLLADGDNFDSDGTCAAIDGNFTQATLDQLDLGPLADNGGRTETHALGFESVAVDAVLECTEFVGAPLGEDQRAVDRPQDGDGDGDARCDVGAFERGEAIVVDGTCTLGDAIEAANLDQATVGGCVDHAAGPDTLVLDVDTVLVAADTVRSTALAGSFAGLPDITSPITLRAGLADRIERSDTLDCELPDGDDEFRLLQTLFPDGQLTLEGVTLTGGCADRGGAIFAGGKLTVEGSLVAYNRALSIGVAQGGAISVVEGDARIVDSRFLGNDATGLEARGGAVYVDGALEIEDTLFQENSIRSADATAEGGALYAFELVSMRRVIFESNQARGGDRPLFHAEGASGGGLYAEEALELRDVLFSNNEALGGHGDRGGFAEGAAATVTTFASMTDVSLVHNRAEGGSGQADRGGDATGGALRLGGEGDLTGLTFSGNSARGGSSVSSVGGEAVGGAIYSGGAYVLEASTASENEAVAGNGGGSDGDAFGGGLYASDPIEVRGSLFEGNVARVGLVDTASDCDRGGDPVISLGYNVVGAPTICDFTATGDQTGVGPSLLPLGDHGCVDALPDGVCLPTYPVEIESAAADAGSCTASGLTEDARGFSRPVDDPDVANADDGCDAGAYESRDEDEGTGDGVEDAVDNCPADVNPDQADIDGDGLGDACDLCRGDNATGDADGDRVCADLDVDDGDPTIGIAGSIFLDGFENGDTTAWSTTVL